jgi:hypothetical protein
MAVAALEDQAVITERRRQVVVPVTEHVRVQRTLVVAVRIAPHQVEAPAEAGLS